MSEPDISKRKPYITDDYSTAEFFWILSHKNCLTSACGCNWRPPKGWQAARGELFFTPTIFADKPNQYKKSILWICVTLNTHWRSFVVTTGNR